MTVATRVLVDHVDEHHRNDTGSSRRIPGSSSCIAAATCRACAVLIAPRLERLVGRCVVDIVEVAVFVAVCPEQSRRVLAGEHAAKSPVV